jgi:hypothetical protein
MMRSNVFFALPWAPASKYFGYRDRDVVDGLKRAAVIPIGLALTLNRIHEAGTFRIVLGEPLIGRVGIGEHLEMVDVADILAGVDVNHDAFHENDSLTRRMAGCFGFFTLTQSVDGPAR